MLAETADLNRVSDRNKKKVDRVRRWLQRILEGDELPAPERVIAGDTLAMLEDQRPGVDSTIEAGGKLFLPDMKFSLVPPGPFWMGEGDDVHLNEHLNYWKRSKVFTSFKN